MGWGCIGGSVLVVGGVGFSVVYPCAVCLERFFAFRCVSFVIWCISGFWCWGSFVCVGVFYGGSYFGDGGGVEWCLGL